MGQHRDVIIVGGGLAGLSAAIYLGRARRDVLLIDSGQSLASWEPHVENYLGFPDGISGKEILDRGREQVRRYGVSLLADEVQEVTGQKNSFTLQGKKSRYSGKRFLLATGLLHIPPDIPAVSECLGQSMFFCKDCDGLRVQGKKIAIIGANNDAVEYSLGMLHYSPCVIIATNGNPINWSARHAKWLQEYEIAVHQQRIVDVQHNKGWIESLGFEDGRHVLLDCLFTTRGDIVHNKLGRMLGADVDEGGQIIVDHCMRTNVPGFYAAGCVTPANCQMIIAAGQGAVAGQSINRDLFEESLATHSLCRFREKQLCTEETQPEIVADGAKTKS